MPTAHKLIQEDASIRKVLRIVSDSMQRFQRIQNLHPSRQVANLYAMALLTEKECHLTFTWCPSHSGVRDDELADVEAKEGTNVEQEGVSYYYDSVKVTKRRARKESSIAHVRLRRINGDKGKKVDYMHEDMKLSHTRTLAPAHTPCLFSIDLHTVWQRLVVDRFILLLLSGTLFQMMSGEPYHCHHLSLI